MKTVKWIVGLMMLLNVQMATAQSYGSTNLCPPCDICLPNLDFTLYADYLYWKVCRGDLNYNDNDTGETRYTKPDYDHGYRAGIRSAWNCWDLGARYTHYTTRKNLTDGKYEINYKVVDIELGYTVCPDCSDITFRPYAGAKLAWIDEKYDQPDSDDDDRIDFEGYGIYLGAEGKYKLCDHSNGTVSLAVRGSYGIVDGSFEVDRKFNPDRPKDCLYIPYFDVFAGIDILLLECCGVGANVLIGYEVQQWGDYREFDTNDDLLSLGLGGLVVRFGLSF